jgi:broad specificity phosphatase PhoE
MNEENINVYEVQVFAVSDHMKERMLGSWRGVADSEMKAKELAEADVWEQRFTDDGYSPSHAVRIVPRYLVSESWFHSFDGANEGVLRWVYDRADGLVAHAAIRRADGSWLPLTKGQRAHLDKAIVEVLDVDASHEDFSDVKEVESLPGWCSADQGLQRRPKA